MTAPASDTLADAARYAMLRKLAAGMRHTLAGQLQTIQFAAELASRMSHAAAPAPRLADCLAQLRDTSKSATESCRAVIEWMRPDETATLSVEEAVSHCLRLAGDDWSVRGVEASADLAAAAEVVPRAACNEVLMAALLYIVDQHPQPVDIVIAARTAMAEVEFTLDAVPATRDAVMPAFAIHRALTESDLCALAASRRLAISVSPARVAFAIPIAGAA